MQTGWTHTLHQTLPRKKLRANHITNTTFNTICAHARMRAYTAPNDTTCNHMRTYKHNMPKDECQHAMHTYAHACINARTNCKHTYMHACTHACTTYTTSNHTTPQRITYTHDMYICAHTLINATYMHVSQY